MQAGIGQNISLNLRGNQDIIDLTFDPCQQNNCRLPYLPLEINIRQAFGNKTPFLATAKRSGENLNVQIANFPLEILKISPTAAYNIPGIIAGQMNANLDINLFNLQGQGQLEINRPSLGNLIGEKLTANLVYRDSIVQLQEGSLQAGASQYNLQGLFNWQTQEIPSQSDQPIEIITTGHSLLWFEPPLLLPFPIGCHHSFGHGCMHPAHC